MNDNPYSNIGRSGSQLTPPLTGGYNIVAPVRIFVSIAGRSFLSEADTLPEAAAKLTEQINDAIAENDAHSDLMEAFLAAR